MKSWIRNLRTYGNGFEQLPWMTQAVAVNLMRLADDDGIIHAGERPLQSAVCYQMGATRNDRAALTQHLKKLLSSGWLTEVANGCWRLNYGFHNASNGPQRSASAWNHSRPEIQKERKKERKKDRVLNLSSDNGIRALQEEAHKRSETAK